MDIINKIICVWAGFWISLFLIGKELINRELMSLCEVAIYVWAGLLISFFLICLYLREIGITRVIEVPSKQGAEE